MIGSLKKSILIIHLQLVGMQQLVKMEVNRVEVLELMDLLKDHRTQSIRMWMMLIDEFI
jgi:hypothetical protein